MKTLAIISAIGIVSLSVTISHLKRSSEAAEQSRTDNDLRDVANTVFLLEKANGRLPTNVEMRQYLSELGKDRYGNAYDVDIFSSSELVVVVATALGKDGKKGGFGKDSDRVKVISRP